MAPPHVTRRLFPLPEAIATLVSVCETTFILNAVAPSLSPVKHLTTFVIHPPRSLSRRFTQKGCLCFCTTAGLTPTLTPPPHPSEHRIVDGQKKKRAGGSSNHESISTPALCLSSHAPTPPPPSFSKVASPSSPTPPAPLCVPALSLCVSVRKCAWFVFLMAHGYAVIYVFVQVFVVSAPQAT